MPSAESQPLTLMGPLAEPVVIINGEARFRVQYAPEGDDGQERSVEEYEVSETVLPCVVSDPVLAAALTDLEPGTMMHLTGYLTTISCDGDPLRLVVLAVELSTPLPERFTLADAAEQHDDYLALLTLSPGGAQSWHLIHASGAYAGAVSSPEQIPTAIKAHKALRGSPES